MQLVRPPADPRSSACYKKIIVFLLSLLIFPAAAQIPSLLDHRKIDSLQQRLTVAGGTEKVDVLNGLALYLAPRYQDSSLNYATGALQLAEKLDYKKGKGVALFNLGNSYYFRMDVKNALTKYYAALWILEDLGPSKELGDLYYQISFFTSSRDYLYKAMSIYGEIGNEASERFILARMNGDNMDSSIVIYRQNLEYFKKINDQDAICLILYNMSNACFYIRRPEGLQYALEALRIAQEKKDYWLIANLYHKIVNYYENVFNAPEYKTDYALAEHYLFKALENLDKMEEPYKYQLISESYRELGSIALAQKKYNAAEGYLNEAVVNSKIFLEAYDTMTFPEPYFRRFYWGMGYGNFMHIYGVMTRLYIALGDYEKAYKSKILSDSLAKIENLEASLQHTSAVDASFEYERNRQQIALLEKENELRSLKLTQSRILFISIAGVMLAVFLIIMLWVQHRRSRSEHKALLLEQKLLRSQMNPHFIFNSLSSIQNFIVTEKPDKASIYLSKFSRLVRNILDNSTEEFVILQKEISTIENYLELQKVRYAGKFDYNIDIDNDIDTDIVKVPPMLAQPFIENAIEHGIKHRESPGHIHIRFSLKDHTLVFEVEDDGVGRQKAREIEIKLDPGHKSMATSLTLERISNLNRKLQKKIILEIIDLKNALGEATGTRVVFGVPVG